MKEIITSSVAVINKSHHTLPSYATIQSAGMDLRAFIEEPIQLMPMERRLISTGIYMALPIGTEAQIRPRRLQGRGKGPSCKFL
jgi:dUTP pyrophosphatase